MLSRTFCCVLAMACFAGFGCTDNEDPKGAARVWSEIHKDEYRKWDRAPGYETRRKSNSAHGDKVDIYVNDVVAEALAQKKPLDAWPEGSVIVKDGFDGSDLDLTAVMEKKNDKWFFAEYDDEGDPSYSGTPELCTECHERGHDFVRAFDLPKKQ